MADKALKKEYPPITPVAKDASAMRVIQTIGGVTQEVMPDVISESVPAKTDKKEKGDKP